MKLFNIRDMSKEDVPFFLEVRNECREYLDDDREFSLKQCYEWFKIKTVGISIIEYQDNKIGYFRTSSPDVTNKSIWVGADLHKDYRGKGLSKKMYKQFFEYLYDQGFETFILNVLEINDRAISLYKKIGFQECPIRDNAITRSDGKSYNRIRMKIKYENIQL